MSLSAKQQAAVEGLRREGHIVIIWSPYELINLTPEERHMVQDYAVTKGNEAIGELSQGKEDECI